MLLSNAKRNTILIAVVLFIGSMVLFAARAEAHDQQALVIAREIGDRRSEAADLGNLGIIYKDQGELLKAEDHHRQALVIHREIGDRLAEAQNLGNLGLIYEIQGNLAKAEDHQQQALAIAVGHGRLERDPVAHFLRDSFMELSPQFHNFAWHGWLSHVL